MKVILNKVSFNKHNNLLLEGVLYRILRKRLHGNWVALQYLFTMKFVKNKNFIELFTKCMRKSVFVGVFKTVFTSKQKKFVKFL